MTMNMRFFDADNSVLKSLELIHKFKPYNDSTLEMIAESYLWFASLDSLNDPFEGELTYSHDPNLTIEKIFCAEHIFCIDEANIDYEHENLKYEYAEYKENPDAFIDRKREDHKRRYEEIMLSQSKNDGFFCALSEPKKNSAADELDKCPDQARRDEIRRNHEDISLWSHYGDGLRGVRITYDPLRLKHISHSSAALVKYQDSPEPIDATMEVRKRKAYYKDRWNFSQSLMLFNTKATLWSNEREVRIRIGKQGKVDIPPDSIKYITFGSKMPAYRRILMIAAARQNNPDAKFYEARISSKEFKIEYVEYEVPPLISLRARPSFS
jgi:hypothetical protein